MNMQLTGKKIVITRPSDQQEEFASMLSALGAEPVRFPVIAIAPPDSWEAADRAIENISKYDWVIFTSVNGVTSFAGRLILLQKDVTQTLSGIKICAIGLKTAEVVEQYGLEVDFMPDEFRAESVAGGFLEMGSPANNVLLPRAQVGRDILPVELARVGIKVDVIPVYKAIRPDADALKLRKMLQDREIDVVTFTSSSCVKNFVEIIGLDQYKMLLTGVKIACISPVTSDTVKKYGLGVDIIPDRYTVADLAKAIAGYYCNVLQKGSKT
ncbi:MAG: uroporphyrinogen-III synthase [Nitrospirae bacterium]|nr:uroporphyrinogen-III synthase [Nitrospirota bacterium]